jgi:phospholipid/cholesterol/gamma-HCH transport system permease protein
MGGTAKDLLQFFGYVVAKIYAIVVQHKRLPLVSFAHHLDQVGFKAVPIIALISFLIGMVLTYQGINQLARFGAEIYAIDFLTIGVFREIGVMLTAVVVAGRSASSFTAQIGTMSLNQEIDAMRVMRIDPIMYLVLPRMAALLVALPLLVFLSDIMALLGGMLTTQLVIDVTPLQFMNYLQQAFTPATFWVGMSKAPIFALLIGLVGCFRGMQVRESAESVGRMTTASVVEAIFLVIVCNALMSLLFSYLQV